MSTKRKGNGSFDTEDIINQVQSIAETDSVTGEQIIEILRESFDSAYREYESMGNKQNSLDLKCETIIDLNSKKGKIKIFRLRDIVENDDDITDDFLQISLEKAKEIDKKAKAGNVLREPVDLEPLFENQLFIRKVVQYFRQRLTEASKKSLLETYQKLIGSIIVGEVEKVENYGVTLNFGKTSAILLRRNMLKTDKFMEGQKNVKVYLESVGTQKNGAKLQISRTCEGFVKKLLEAEVHEIYDGTVEIVKIVRKPGERSKVVVKSNNPNVNPVTACIGTGSIRNSGVSAALNGEKIDIIKYEPNVEMQIIEAMKPCNIIGLHMPDKAGEEAIVVCNNGDSKIAVGKEGVNVVLASRIVNIPLKVMEIDQALANQITFRVASSIQKDNEERLRDELNAHIQDETPVSSVVADKPVETEVSAEPATETTTEVNENKVSEPQVEVKKAEEPVEKIEIRGRARKSIEELEKELEDERNAKKNVQQPTKKKSENKEVKIAPKEVVETKKEDSLPIYSDEEIEYYDEEDEYDSDEDYDYSEEDEIYDTIYNK